MKSQCFIAFVAVGLVLSGCAGAPDNASGTSDAMTRDVIPSQVYATVSLEQSLSAMPGDMSELQNAVAEINGCPGIHLTYETDAPPDTTGKLITFTIVGPQPDAAGGFTYNINNLGTARVNVNYVSTPYNYQVFLREIAEGLGAAPSSTGLMAPFAIPSPYNVPGSLTAADCANIFAGAQ